ncbi:MAG TPA: CbtA family protein [Beijerinckia sp.]|nr:CbtA family protein [Beijerinckia sp.]
MVGNLLLRGMLAGVLAGLLAVGFATLFGEPSVERAIQLEAIELQAAGHSPEPELVSRDVQKSLGLLTAGVVYGAALGGLFALVFVCAHGRLGPIDAPALSGLLALAGFIAIVLVPALKYPPNPPSIGEPETISLSTGLFFGMMALSTLAMTIAFMTAKSLYESLGAYVAALCGAGILIALTGAAAFVLPSIDEVPVTFPADLLWNFRIASLGTGLVLWSAMGVAFGALTRTSLASYSRRAQLALR